MEIGFTRGRAGKAAVAATDREGVLAGTYQSVRDALYLAAHDSAWCGQPLPWLRDMLTAFVSSNQIGLLSRDGMPAAFLVWAYLDPRAERRFVKHGVGKLTASDITGGTRTWLIGICSPFHAEDFGALLAWAGANLGDGKGGGML